MAFLPPGIAIGLALITKEVYSSLFVGIISFAMFIAAGYIQNAWTCLAIDVAAIIIFLLIVKVFNNIFKIKDKSVESAAKSGTV